MSPLWSTWQEVLCYSDIAQLNSCSRYCPNSLIPSLLDPVMNKRQKSNKFYNQNTHKVTYSFFVKNTGIGVATILISFICFHMHKLENWVLCFQNFLFSINSKATPITLGPEQTTLLYVSHGSFYRLDPSAFNSVHFVMLLLLYNLSPCLYCTTTVFSSSWVCFIVLQQCSHLAIQWPEFKSCITSRW